MEFGGEEAGQSLLLNDGYYITLHYITLHLADAFIQSDLQKEDIIANRCVENIEGTYVKRWLVEFGFVKQSRKRRVFTSFLKVEREVAALVGTGRLFHN